MKAPKSEGPEPGYVIAAGILIPWVKNFQRWHFEGTEYIPPTGPAIIAANHISLFDPLAVGWTIHRNGRRPRFLGKSSLFRAPVVGWVLKTALQIRVDRGTASAPASLTEAERALSKGEVVVIFPEGTTTKAEDLTPLPPKTGVARLALHAGMPVIPCATWGGQWIWSYHMGFRPGLRKEVWVRLGPPMHFKEYAGREDDPEAWSEVAQSIMNEIAVLLAGLKAAKPWTPRPLTKRAYRKLKKQGRI